MDRRKGFRKKGALIAAVIAVAVCTGVSSAQGQGKIGFVPARVFGPPEIQYLKDAIPEMLMSRVSAGAKERVSKDALKQTLTGLDTADELVQTKQLIEKMGYEAVVIGAYTRMADAFSLDVRVLKKGSGAFKSFFVTGEKEGKLFDAVTEIASGITAVLEGREAVFAPAPAVKTVSQAGGKTFTRLKVAEIGVAPTRGICLADLDGDKSKELVVAATNAVHVYRMDGNTPLLMYSHQIKEYEILSVNAGDFNGNGRDELYVTALSRDEATTGVFETDSAGKLQKILETDWYLRVMNHPVDGDVLTGQRMGRNDAFTGEIYLMDLKAAGLFARKPVETGKALNIYQIQPIRYRGEMATAYLDESDFLRVIDEKGKGVTRLTERYGGSVLGVYRGFDEMREPKFTPLHPRMFRIPDGDTDRLVLLKNEGNRYFLRSKGFDKGRVVALGFDEIGYKEVAAGEIIDGYLSDIAVDRSKERVFVAVVSENKEGRIYIFQN